MNFYRMNIATSLNEKYVPYTYVMLSSLFKNNLDAEIYVYLFYSHLNEDSLSHFDELADKYNNHIISMPIDKSAFPHQLFPENHPTFSIENYFRLLIPELLADEIERILYLDGDIIINKPLKELYNESFDNKLLIVAHDIGMTDGYCSYLSLQHPALANIFNPSIYFNSGVMLYNLSLFKESGISSKTYLDYAKQVNYVLPFVDQDLYNAIHSTSVKYMDALKYNFLVNYYTDSTSHIYDKNLSETCIFHFATGAKPWKGSVVHNKLHSLWWDYANDSIFSNELKNAFIKEVIENKDLSSHINVLQTTIQKLTQDLTASQEQFFKLKNITEQLLGN